ncbi:4Fe-4S binding protein [Anaeromyxobacter oryzisoli]|uniref:4Fe-4S binding protein n=1 Tax=Anaeromyxobacter oryzisoli TaxID=2925408 RepID=UPI001F580669|nr:4Fe-4S binding protein [Anaeromyxobacter sp. SG63]
MRSSERRQRRSREAARVANAPGARAREAHAARPGARLAAQIERRARALGASLVGFAPVARWAEAGEVPEAYRPTALWPAARTVVTFGVPMLLPVIDSTPSINYQEMYDASNRLLDDLGYRLAVWLSDRGHASVFLPRDGYGSLEVLLENPFGSFSHAMAGKYAGLGTIGLHHSLITPEYGPRVRLGSIFTAAELPGDGGITEELCNGCRLCERLCPAGALRRADGEVVGHLDKDACTRHHMVLRDEKRWPCGVCVKVCPIGADRKVFQGLDARAYREERTAIARNPDDPRYRALVHLRRHGSRGDRIA